MIQRKQSIFLLLAAVPMFIMYKMPIATFVAGSSVYKLLACHIQNSETGEALISVVPMAVLPLLSAVLSLISIFKYNNRKLQMQIGKVNSLVLLALIAVQVIYFFRIQTMLSVNGTPGFSAIIPLIVLVLVLMANRAIKKDDDLVKSADRIR